MVWPAHPNPGAFGGLEEMPERASSRYAVLPVPFDGTSTWQKGADRGPAAVLSASANIFVGQTEAPLVVKPFVDTMTRSELMAVMTGGFATVAEISQGVYEALITSAAGLMVAIPAFVFYSHLRAYSRTLIHDMESAGIEIVNTICDLRTQPNDIIAMRPDVSSEEAAEPGSSQSPARGES